MLLNFFSLFSFHSTAFLIWKRIFACPRPQSHVFRRKLKQLSTLSFQPLNGNLSIMTTRKIKSLDEMLIVRKELRDKGKKLVFTNGCFDILHVGHTRFLNQARLLGDALLVAVNSDRSVQMIKGETRPIVTAVERAEVLAALESVDYVIFFDELTPQRIIEAIVPDVLVKGADWGISEIVGRSIVEEAGGMVCNVPLVEGASTSDIIGRVKKNFILPSPPDQARQGSDN
jgi:rfaE bifunctional protein nucleotidyltransferase chain/domain